MNKSKKTRNIDTIYEKAKEYEEAGDLKKAEKYYRDALVIEENPGTWGILGWVLLHQHLQKGSDDFQEALAAAQNMRSLALKFKSRPLLAVADCLIGTIHQHAGQMVPAERYYRESLEAKPRTETYVFLGFLLDQLGRFEEAKKCYQRATLVDPQNKEAHYNLALCHKNQGEYEKAVRHLYYVVDIDEHDSRAMLNLASTLWYLGNDGIQEAKSILNKLLRSNPRNIECRILLAFVYKLLRKLKDAEILFRLTIEQLPSDSRVYWSFAYFLANDLKDNAEAEFYFKKAIQLSPESGAAFYYYGQFLVNIDRGSKGKEYLEKAAELGFEKAKPLLETLQLAAAKKED
jgi:tetratricopeptide (TPR) repeat protein